MQYTTSTDSTFGCHMKQRWGAVPMPKTPSEILETSPTLAPTNVKQYAIGSLRIRAGRFVLLFSSETTGSFIPRTINEPPWQFPDPSSKRSTQSMDEPGWRRHAHVARRV